ncbi:MAG: TRAP transporter small permease [Deltaproteobacteria bacterium]|nr:TRAP transporter small permease [Deltaproteobacteria bacterium]
MNPIRWLIPLNNLFARIEGYLLVVVLLIALFFAFLQVILRNFFDSGIAWGDVFTRHLVLWIAFFGATISTLEDKHIKIDALLKVLPKRAVPIIEILIHLFCIVVSYLLFDSAYRFIVGEKLSGSTLFEGIPTWYFIVIMPVGFGLITFRFFVKFIESLYVFAGKKMELNKPLIAAEELDISVKIKLK